MRLELQSAEVLSTFDAPKLDPITVVLIDHGRCGMIIVQCYGNAWSAYFGATGTKSLREFLCGVSPDYLAGKMAPQLGKFRKSDEAYLKRIVAAVLSALVMQVTEVAS